MTSSTPLYATLDAWISQASIPVPQDSPEHLEAAVAKVVASLGDAVELLGFGEALHGGEDILMVRNRLFQRLVEAHGFRAIAVESSFPRGPVANAYLAGEGPATFEELQDTGFSHGFGQLEANRELVAWMRQYNADPAHGVKLHFYGFDMPALEAGPASPSQVVRVVLDYLETKDSAMAQAYRERIDPLLGQDADWENPAAWADPSHPIGRSPAAVSLRIETENLISELKVRRPEWGDESRYQGAMHYAQLARQYLRFYAEVTQSPEVSLGIRDALMADNLAYIADLERGRGKVFVFAHNAHLQKGKVRMAMGPFDSQWWPAGAHLRLMLGSRYAAIGTAVGVSEANGIGQPEAGTLEARLTAQPGPVRFIPTHQREGLPASEIAALPTRSGSARNPSYAPLSAQSFTHFDGWVVLDSTVYQRGGRQLPP